MSGPSEVATEAAHAEYHDREGPATVEAMVRDVLAAAHDPALGLDRSVCLRDVVEALSRADANVPAFFRAGRAAAEFLEREFGGRDR